jgi:pimeloyl-ACP methyl ester carboxylesterase
VTMRRVRAGAFLAGALLGAAAAAAGPVASGGALDKPQLVYLHGRIVGEQQDRRPKHPQFGYYELDQILDAFRQRGFAVTSEMRPKGQALGPAAERAAAQVRALHAAGVPSARITVLGASMGAEVALLAASKLHDPELRFALLGACLSLSVPELWAERGRRPAGHLLAIREKSDETSEPCPPWTSDTASRGRLEVRELLLDTGLRHGFLYRPLREWVDPVVEWATRR